MNGSWWKGSVVLLSCIVFCSLLTSNIHRSFLPATTMVDFGEIYFGARVALKHQDPYDAGTMLRDFEAAGGRFPADPINGRVMRTVATNAVNLPTAFFLAIPFALLPWSVAQTLWLILIAGFLTVAAALLWDLGASRAPLIWVCLAGFMLADCETLLLFGNVAGIVVGFSVVATWCFFKDRLVLAGVLLFAISLAVKPHDAGFVWLYFLLAGGALRKRALQTLVIAAILGILTTVWIAQSSPHWPQELHRNLAAELVRGGVDDPGLSGITSDSIGAIISLQAALSVFWDNPHFYNPASYLIAGSLILVWAFATLRKRATPESALLALAAISALTLLPVYHRPYDAKLLLLAIPACAMLWSQGGARRWIALVLTSLGILLTSDSPLILLLAASDKLAFSPSTLTGKLMTALVLRPTPLALLLLGSFYLWTYIRYRPSSSGVTLHDGAAKKSAATSAEPNMGSER